MALYRRKRIKDRRNGAPPPAFTRDGVFVPNPTFESADKAPDPMANVANDPEHDTSGDVNKEAQ